MELYTTVEAGNYLGLTSKTMQRYIKLGKLAAIKKGKTWLIKQEDLKKLEQADWFQIEKSLKTGRPRKNKSVVTEALIQ